MNPRDTDDASPDHCESKALMLFLDGELALEQQPSLFGHLSRCSTCRHVMNATFDFRRITREERFDVPSWSDNALYQRIDACRDQWILSSRKHRRVSAWSVRTNVSVRSIVVGLALVIISTLLFATRVTERQSISQPAYHAHANLERSPHATGEAIYVFYPGVVVESQRED